MHLVSEELKENLPPVDCFFLHSEQKQEDASSDKENFFIKNSLWELLAEVLGHAFSPICPSDPLRNHGNDSFAGRSRAF